MKDVSQETLQAIQSNVKVEETQSLERSVDNLLQASWKDFEVADLQPNLIPNGWDSFEPYGSGENYVENWDFKNGNSIWITHMSIELEYTPNNTVIFTKTHENWGGITQPIKQMENPLYRVKARWIDGEKPKQFKVQHNTWQTPEFDFKEKNKWEVFEFERGGTELAGSLYLFFRDVSQNSKVEVDWISVSENDNQHLVVEKTPLGNELIRIQTWGGNDKMKLRHTIKNRPNTMIFSVFAENKSTEYRMRFGDGWTSSSHTEYLMPLESKILSYKFDDRGAIVRVETIISNHNLDFIASTPTIVEGDKHNPVLVVDQLDDGTEHVRVYGAYPDTKLVYKGGKGFIGENYKLTSNIKNEGVELGINTSIGSSTIPKGDSKLEIEGELQEQDFTIEIGARDV